MQNRLATLVASGLLLAGGTVAAQAPQSPSGSPAEQGRPGTVMQHRATSEHAGQGSMMGRDMGGHMMREGMHGSMQGPHGKGPGRHGPNMLVMMMAMMDTNGDRALSLEEVQAVHERVFRYADTDNDGRLTMEELRGFFHGGGFDSDR